MDLIIVADPDIPFDGWAGGGIGTIGGESGTWAQNDWSASDFLDDWSATKQFEVERKFLLPVHRFTEGANDNHALLMAWGSDWGHYTFYIDNVKFYDDSGNLLEVYPGSAAAPVAPVADTSSDNDAPVAPRPSPNTGNAPVVAVVAVMALAGVAAVTTRKRK